jgi:hypothetical protein
MLPFTSAQFLDVFAAYNNAIWPTQIAAYGLGFLSVATLFSPGIAADRIIAAVLALMWVWTGIAYHWLHFSSVNPAAWVFGAAFVLQGVIFVIAGTMLSRMRLRFGPTSNFSGFAGLAFILYAAVIYPLLGISLGHSYPRAPLFGVTPCPVTIFTFGWMLLLKAAIQWWVIAIPVLWSLIGGTAAFLLDVPQDWLLLVGGVVTALLLTTSRRLSFR